MKQKLGTYFQFTHGSLQEFISALCPFLLLGIISPVSALLAKNALLAGAMVVNVVGVAIFCVLIILFLAGFFTGMPRWFLPYVGLLLSFLSAMGFSLLLQKWDVIPFPALYSRSWYMGQIAFQGSLWGGLTLSAILLVSLTTLLPFLRRFKTDWTQLAFLLYGASPFALAITFDDYVNDELSTLLAFLVLMAGIWFYLRINNPRIQFWVLFGAMTVSMLFTAVAKAVIYQYFWIGIRHFTWWTEMMSTVIMWGWLALTLLIPLVLSGRTPEVRSTSLAGAQK